MNQSKRKARASEKRKQSRVSRANKKASESIYQGYWVSLSLNETETLIVEGTPEFVASFRPNRGSVLPARKNEVPK